MILMIGYVTLDMAIKFKTNPKAILELVDSRRNERPADIISSGE